jgi:signal peptidase I
LFITLYSYEGAYMETQNTVNTAHQRRPWIAALLSLVMPGLGHVYCGDIESGIVLMSIVTGFSAGWLVGIVHPNTPFLSFSVGVGSILLLALIIAVIDSCRRALRTRHDYVLKDYNRCALYMCLLWIAGAGSIGYAVFVKKTMFEAFRVPVNTMAPTIMAGDRMIVSKLAYRNKDPQRGDVVILKNPANLRKTNVKRIVALGNETIELKQGQLIINGQPLARERIESKTIICAKPVAGSTYWESNGNARYPIFIPEQTESLDFGPVTVPPHHCFLLADARNPHNDSRSYGTVSLGAILGKFQTVYWPLRRH